MSSSDPSFEPALPISAVERETGLSKDVLRKWEVRYGFPVPERDAGGERLYPAEQVARLRLIKRLLDAGMRPSRVVGQAPAVLADLAERQRPARSPSGEDEATAFLTALRNHDAPVLRQTLNRLLHQEGLRTFVQDRLAGLTELVGEAWARGELDIHEEHLFTEVVQGLLRGVIEDLNDPRGRPRVLLTTLPGETHGLGLLMVAAMLGLEGAYTLSLGLQTPLQDIRAAAIAREIDVVGLSFSMTYPARRIVPALTELRQVLPDSIAIWAGGDGALRTARPEVGIAVVSDLAELAGVVTAWRHAHLQ